MKILIKKNRHYPWLIPIALPKWVRKNSETTISGEFMFTESCIYDLHDEDQWDVNKLMGFSIGHHHKCNSFRFGWRPNKNMDKISIVAYEYRNSIRQKTLPITEVGLNEWHRYELSYDSNIIRTRYSIDNRIFADLTGETIRKSFGLGYTLGVYFGGNEKAPHDISIFKRKTQ